MGSEGGRGEERAGWKNGGRDDGPNCCIGHWREREKERGRGRRRRESEKRRGKSLLESAGASASVYAAPSSASPAEQSAACYKPTYILYIQPLCGCTCEYADYDVSVSCFSLLSQISPASQFSPVQPHQREEQVTANGCHSL